MWVGMCRITLRLPENGSLKGKRQVVRSVIERLRNKFNVSAAEVDDNDRWQVATIGVTCVSNDAKHAERQLQEVVKFVERQRLDAELLDTEFEVTSY
jgi:uncharacterized protein YlxP (DUF503 family)